MTRLLNYPPPTEWACIAATQSIIDERSDSIRMEAYCTAPTCDWVCGHRHVSYTAAINCASKHVNNSAG